MASIRSAPRRQISSRARTNSWRASSVAATLSIGVPPFAGVTTPVSPINDRPEGTPRPSPGPASTTFVHTSPTSAADVGHLNPREPDRLRRSDLGVPVGTPLPASGDHRGELLVEGATAQERPQVVAARREEAREELPVRRQPRPDAVATEGFR